jgi:hypothetical protein
MQLKGLLFALKGMFKHGLIFIMLMQYSILYAYDKPNSIAQKPNTNFYYITNTAGKSVTELDSNLNKKDIITGLIKPKDILFATFGPYHGLLILDSNEVKVYDANGFSLITSFKVKGAIELEDIEMDKTTTGIFYMSDPLAHKIFKAVIGPAPFYTPTFTELNAKLRHPKALLFDSKDRLLVTTDTSQSEIYNINTINGTHNLIITTNIGYINALSEDLQGNYYATSWGDNYFYRLDKDFKNPKDLALYNKPTGLCFSETMDVMLVACSNCNKIEFHKLHMVYINDVDSVNCKRDSFNVNVSLQFKGKGTYFSNNTFYVEISDLKGNFSSATIIGSIKSATEPTDYRVILPKNKVFLSSNYKIRVRSTHPVFYSINEIETFIPYAPSSFINLKDTVFFCNPTKLKIGVVKDIDSGFVKYLWFENGKLINQNASYYEKVFTSKTMLVLQKKALEGPCYLNDSSLLIPSTNIDIPFKDHISTCEKTWVKLGGDSIYQTKIEWTSKTDPIPRYEFNPSYYLRVNDTFLVKVTSLNGTCFSQKTIYTTVYQNPELALDDSLNVCAGDLIQLKPNLLKGNWNTIQLEWQPNQYLVSDSSKLAYFQSDAIGSFDYILVGKDTNTHCMDTVNFKINNIPKPNKPILAENKNGVVIKNFKPNYEYIWLKDGKIIFQTTTDSQCVLPQNELKWGNYQVIVTNRGFINCADTSLPYPLIFTKLPKINALKVQVYPNPASQRLYINQLAASFDCQIHIYTLTGMLVLKPLIVENGSINISELKPGIYFIRLNFEDQIYQGRFIKD